MALYPSTLNITLLGVICFTVGAVLAWALTLDYERYIRNRSEVLKELFKDPELLDICAEAYKEKYESTKIINKKGGD